MTLFGIMHISSYTKIVTPDTSTLERVSENDVMMWIAAKLSELRPAVDNIQLQGCIRNYRNEPPYADVSWTMHGADKVAMTHKSTASCYEHLCQELSDNPKQRAAEARMKAARLMKEAEEIEAASVMPNNDSTTREG